MSESCRILVVDDEPRGVELLVRTLRSLGTIETALSGEEAWQRVQESPPDIVISDQRMPGMTGVELLTRLAALDDSTGRILLTGYADLEATTDSINFGRVHAYLTKPCSPKDVQLAVRSVQERVNLARENTRLVSDLYEKNDRLSSTLGLLEEAQKKVVHSERLAAIGRMIAMIVHDLRSPITVIRSAGQEIVTQAGEADGSELSDLGKEVVEEAEHMQRVCEELLEVTRASEGGGETVPVNIDEVVQSALVHVAEKAGQLGVAVDLDLAAGVTLPLNEDRIRRALRNLSDNAIEAMGDGGVLRVETRIEGSCVRLSVIDNGPGIADVIQDKIFEPFITHGKKGGSGLGLAVVKKVVQDHGGSIEAAKAEGGGTTFNLLFPFTAS